MSVRQGMLALLARASRCTRYQLRQQFEARTGGTWPLNMGQVSTTLDRLDRDGLVEPRRPATSPRPTRSTDAGRAALREWWSTPGRPHAPRSATS